MRKNKNTKIIAIIALAILLVGLSLGFAVFSDVLIINSSATVTPNEEDFKLSVYGLVDEEELQEFYLAINKRSFNFDLLKWSTDEAVSVNAGLIGELFAEINNDTFTVNNIAASFVEPDYETDYFFVIKNEGLYDAYVDFSNYNSYLNGLAGKCLSSDGVTLDLMNAACNDIVLGAVFVDSEGQIISSSDTSYKIAKNDYVLLSIAIYYADDGARADGPFTVLFDDIQFEFSTAV